MQPIMKTKPGPKRLDYVPHQFRGIQGVEQLTTVRQLENLKRYLETPVAQRPPYVRIGASVPQYCEDKRKLPTATYVVMVDGAVTVMRKQRDPRNAEKWFKNPRRPWNLSAKYDSHGGDRA